VVIRARITPLEEAFSFLDPFSAIILYNAITVKPISASSPLFTTSSPSNHSDILSLLKGRGSHRELVKLWFRDKPEAQLRLYA
jgi:hypothetical protein